MSFEPPLRLKIKLTKSKRPIVWKKPILGRPNRVGQSQFQSSWTGSVTSRVHRTSTPTKATAAFKKLFIVVY